MICNEARQHWSLYHDSEGDAELHFQISEHLATCPDCAEWFSQQSRLESLLVEKLPSHKPTPELWNQVLAGSGLIHRAPPRRWLWFGGVAASAAVLVAAALLIWNRFAVQDLLDLTKLIASRHQRPVERQAVSRHQRLVEGQETPDYSKAIDLRRYNKARPGMVHKTSDLQPPPDLTKAIELDPKDARAWAKRGWAYKELGKPQEALADLTKAIQLDPTYARAWADRGWAYEQLGQPQKALADLTKAIELDPKDAFAWADRGWAYEQLGQWEKAIADYTMSITLDPKYAWSRNGLAWVLATCPEARLRDPTWAVAAATRAVELEPRRESFWQTLGWAEYRAGHWQATIRALQKAEALGSPGDSLEWFPLAMAHWQLGNIDEARKRYDRAVEWMDKNDPKNELLRRTRAEAAKLLGIKEKKN
jgi:Flp pilus assembly protein TadD